jgi:hypothetical protein
MAGNISMGARREVVAEVAERYRSAGRREKGRILDELTAVTGWHRKHAVRVLRAKPPTQAAETVPRKRRYNAAIRDAVTALWEAYDRVCGKRLEVMIPALLPALERHGRLTLSRSERALVLSASAATIDRMLVGVKVAAAGGRRRRVGFCSAIRREVPIHVQRLVRSAARLLRDRHGRTRWYERGGLVHPDVDLDGHRYGLDRMSAAGGARRQPGCRSDDAVAEPVPVAHVRCRLRQRQRLHE